MIGTISFIFGIFMMKNNYLSKLFPYFQTSSFAEWIKCTQRYAAEGLFSHDFVEILCNEEKILNMFPPKCDHVDLFFKPPEVCKEE